MITSSPELLARVGQKTYEVRAIPATSAPLSSFIDLEKPGSLEFPEFTAEYRQRVRAVSEAIGWHHADSGLTDPTFRVLDIDNSFTATQRFNEIQLSGLKEAGAWLCANDIQDIDLSALRTRVEMTAFLMRDRRFRATWSIAINNPYPDRILVDKDDPTKVHCLADTTYEANITLRDRMMPLARLAYCVKLPREMLKEDIFDPYFKGFTRRVPLSDGPSASSNASASTVSLPYPFCGPVVEEEKFFLILHVMHLDFVLYWIRFRNAPSVRRIWRRILEDDKLFDQWYFAPGRFVPLFDLETK